MNIHNRRYTDKQHDCTWEVITLIVMIAAALIWQEELWAGLDWVLTVTENFHAR